MPHSHSAKHGGGGAVWQDGALASATGVIGEADFGWEPDPQIQNLKYQIDTMKQQRQSATPSRKRWFDEQIRTVESQLKRVKEEDERRKKHGGPGPHDRTPTAYPDQPGFPGSGYNPGLGNGFTALPVWTPPVTPIASPIAMPPHMVSRFTGETGELAGSGFGELGGVKNKKFG